MRSMERRSIDLKTISGKGIKSFALLKSSLYATVFLAGGSGGHRPDLKRKKQRTPADRTGGENPEWEHPIRIVLDSQDKGLVLQFDITAHGFLGDRLVGRVRVPVADLLPEDPAGAFHAASYRVQTSGGKPNGVLSFLYKMNGGEGRSLPPDPAVYSPPPTSAAGYTPPKMEHHPPSTSASGYYPPPPVGYPPAPVSAIYYPPQEPAIYYPPPPVDSGYCPRPYPAIGYPAATVGGYYPPASQVHVACYPPQEPYGYLMEDYDRDTYRCYRG
ncbi:uncharacterized protein [Elaeis guineensis]|uniref:uncharacterized protein n=1 Tax=Elaeis guineensis var. tenera TaxID=51953 RepID=UPI003C6DB080